MGTTTHGQAADSEAALAAALEREGHILARYLLARAAAQDDLRKVCGTDLAPAAEYSRTVSAIELDALDGLISDQSAVVNDLLTRVHRARAEAAADAAEAGAAEWAAPGVPGPVTVAEGVR